MLRFQRARTTVKRAQPPESVTVDSVTLCTPSGPPTRSVTVSYPVNAYLRSTKAKAMSVLDVFLLNLLAIL